MSISPAEVLVLVLTALGILMMIIKEPAGTSCTTTIPKTDFSRMEVE
jgi:hypothetical protein